MILQNWFFLHVQLGKSWLVKILFWSSNSAWEKTTPGKKPEVNSYHVLRIHSPLHLRLQPWTNWWTQTKNKKEGAKRYFKFQVENYEISVCLSLSVSQCVSLFLDNIRLIYKWALFKFRFTWTEKYSILNI